MLLRRPVPHSRLLRTVFVATVLAVAVGAVVVRTMAAPPGARAAEVSPPGRPPGLVQAGDSKTTCVFAGSGAWKSGLQAANVATGMDFQCLEIGGVRTFTAHATNMVTDARSAADPLSGPVVARVADVTDVSKHVLTQLAPPTSGRRERQPTWTHWGSAKRAGDTVMLMYVSRLRLEGLITFLGEGFGRDPRHDSAPS